MITEALLQVGFKKTKYDDYDCVMRIHEIHYMFWSENLKHFALGVKNVSGKKEAGGYYKEFNLVVIPRPIYTIAQALQVFEAMTSRS